MAAAFRGEFAASFARLAHFPIALTDAARRLISPSKAGGLIVIIFFIEADARSYRFSRRGRRLAARGARKEVAPGAYSADRPARIAVVSFIGAAVAQPYGRAFRNGLRALGWIEGCNVTIEERFAEGEDLAPIAGCSSRKRWASMRTALPASGRTGWSTIPAPGDDARRERRVR